MTYKQNTLDEQNRDSFFRTRNLEIEKRNNVYKKPSLFLLILLLVCISYDSNAAECVTPRGGYFHTTYDADLTYYTHHNADVSTCTDTVLMTGIEYAVLQERSSSLAGLEELLVTLFAFDAEVFAIVELGLIMAFLTSHYGGRVVRWLGK
jgi:hypothetical protein